MADNQTFNHFSSHEMKHIRDLLVKLTEAVQPKLILNPAKEKDDLGQYNKEKRLFIGKIVEYKLRHPELSSKDLDWDTFNLLFADSVFLKSAVLLLRGLLQRMNDTRAVYDEEIYKTALADYEYSRKNLGAPKKAYEGKCNDLKQLLSNKTEEKNSI